MDLLSRLFIFSPTKDRKKFTNVFISSQMYSSRHSKVSGIKISNVMKKETSQILLQALWRLWKLQINLVSL